MVLSREWLLRDFSRGKLWAVKEEWRAWEHRVPASVAGMHSAREILLQLSENATRMQGLRCTCRMSFTHARSFLPP